MRHLLRMAAHSSHTNMHARNLAHRLGAQPAAVEGHRGDGVQRHGGVHGGARPVHRGGVHPHPRRAALRGCSSPRETPRRSLLLGGGGAGGRAAPAVPRAGCAQPGRRPPPRSGPTTPSSSSATTGGRVPSRPRSGDPSSTWAAPATRPSASWRRRRRKMTNAVKSPLRPAKSMDSLSSVPFAGDGKRERPGDPSPSPRRDEGTGRSRGPPESEGESSTKSEPTTPKAGRGLAGGPRPLAQGRPQPRREVRGGPHLRAPSLSPSPFHITSNLSRLTRGLPCPALAQAAAGRDPPRQPSAARPPLCRGPRAPHRRAGSPWSCGTPSPSWTARRHGWRAAGDGDPAAWSPLLDTGPGDSEGFPAIEEGMESGFMNPGEPPAEQPGSYLSIEECMEEEMFFMAPSGSDAEDRAGDTDSDDMFLSAHDELSPLAAALEPLEQAPGEASAPQSPARPGGRRTAGQVPVAVPCGGGCCGQQKAAETEEGTVQIQEGAVATGEDPTSVAIASIQSAATFPDPNIKYVFRTENGGTQVMYRVIQVADGQLDGQTEGTSAISGYPAAQSMTQAVIQGAFTSEDAVETEAAATETHYTYFPTAAVADTSTSAGAGTTATAVVTTQNSEALLGQPTPTGQFFVMMSPQEVLQGGAQRSIAPRAHPYSPKSEAPRATRDEKRRAQHNEVERRRRDKINNWIVQLSKIIPDCSMENTKSGQSKGGILSKACDYIQELRQSNHRLSEELQGLDQLQMDNEVLRQQVEDLKNKNLILRAQLRQHGVEIVIKNDTH
ncbi:unnamed protein product [Bubo scandiacus]